MELSEKYERLLTFVKGCSKDYKPGRFEPFDEWYEGAVTQGNADDTFSDGQDYADHIIGEHATKLLAEIGEPNE